MNKNVFLVVFVALFVIGGGYWAYANRGSEPVETTNQAIVTSGENPEPGSIHDLPVEPAAAAARKDLAQKLGMEEKSIVILSVEEKTWSDGCLGLGGPAESCIQMLVDGFKVEMLAKGESYTYRTDKTGASLRAETNN